MPGFTGDSEVRAASGPDLREEKRSLKALEKTTAAIRRRKTTGMAWFRSMKRRSAGWS